jgi:hypothetical protein
VNLFDFIPGYRTTIFESGKEPMLVLLLAFLITFVITRGYTRAARVRGWGSGSVGGVHLHHIVVGIVLVLGSGLLFIGSTPDEGFFQLLLAAAFGSGAALVLDEFALVFRLQDVYWTDEGRSSIDAIVIAVVLGALVLLHATPFGAGDAADVGRWTLVGYVALNLAAVTVTLAKGKLLTAMFGTFLPIFAFIGAIRLARPQSLWARRFYPEGSHRLKRAELRAAHSDRRWAERRRRLEDLIGGAPGTPAGD